MGRTWKLWTVGMLLALCGLSPARAQTPPQFILGVSPEAPSDRDVVKLSFVLDPPRCLPLFRTAIAGNRITVTGDSDAFPVSACLRAGPIEIPVGPLPAGFYTVDLTLDGAPLGATAFRVHATDVPQGDLRPSVRLPAPGDAPRLTASVTSDCRVTFAPPAVSGNQIEVAATTAPPCANEPALHTAELPVGPLPAGTYVAELTIDGTSAATRVLPVAPPGTALALLSGRFLVMVTRDGPPGPTYFGNAVRLGDESGYFWFFDSANLEITAKVLDGREVNGKIWVFLASMTNVAWTATVYDLGDGTCAANLAACSQRTYVNPAGRNGNFVDTSAFDAGQTLSPTGGGTPGVPPVHRLLVSPRLPTAADPVEVRVVLDHRCTAFFPAAQVDGAVIRFDLFTRATCPTTPISFPPAATVGPLPPGIYQVQARVDGVLLPVQLLEVTPAVPALDLLGGVELTLDWTLPGGGGRAYPVALSAESGYFWFFDPRSAEVTAKLLDGRAVNGHLWLFLASMTDVSYTLTVVDRRVPGCDLAASGCPKKSYTGAAGKNANLIDVGLF
jgi:hypothetical protein